MALLKNQTSSSSSYCRRQMSPKEFLELVVDDTSPGSGQTVEIKNGADNTQYLLTSLFVRSTNGTDVQLDFYSPATGPGKMKFTVEVPTGETRHFVDESGLVIGAENQPFVMNAPNGTGECEIIAGVVPVYLSN